MADTEKKESINVILPQTKYGNWAGLKKDCSSCSLRKKIYSSRHNKIISFNDNSLSESQNMHTD